MKIYGIENMTIPDIQDEIGKGGKFLVYTSCYSAIVVSFKQNHIVFVRGDENRIAKSMKYTLHSFLFGWWGLPWGIIYTCSSLFRNFSGGKNITEEIMSLIHSQTRGPVFDFEKEISAEKEQQFRNLAK